MPAIKSYFDPFFQCEAVKIWPGQYYATDRDILIGTTLGSCVAACIRDRVSGIGGMNHFMLPYDLGEPEEPAPPSARYGIHAMGMLVRHVIRLGALRKNLEAKVFGGGKVSLRYASLNIGERNAQFVREYLNREGIIIKAEDLADSQGRQVFFFPRNGKVLVRRLTVALAYKRDADEGAEAGDAGEPCPVSTDGVIETW